VAAHQGDGRAPERPREGLPQPGGRTSMSVIWPLAARMSKTGTPAATKALM
jgi:hypothetical protein